MRILHISDYHISGNDVEQDKNILITENLIKKVTQIHSEKNIDLIIFTGDSILKGGKEFNNIQEAFDAFQVYFVEPLLEALNLGKDRFFLCPGNHDIQRDLDSKMTEKGTADSLTSTDVINDFLEDEREAVRSMQRIIPFKTFEKGFMEGVHSPTSYKLTNLHSVYKVIVNDVKVGICCLNTAWRCYDSNNDQGRIVLGTKQIIDSLPMLHDCDVKIALSHHHYSWMRGFEVNDIAKLVVSNFNIYFCGHTHSPSEELTIKPFGRTFTLVAPGILSHNIVTQDKYQNGFSIVDYDIESHKFCHCKFLSDLSGNFIDGGIWEEDIPCGQEEKDRMEMQKIVLDLKDEVDVLNKHLLTYQNQTDAPKSLSEIFVMPTITKVQENNRETADADFQHVKIESLNSLINASENFVIFGEKESGKTILLDKILLDILNDWGNTIIPIHCNFNDISGDILKIVRTYWGKSKSEAERMLNKWRYILLIDNISFDYESYETLNILKEFLDKHPNIRFIGTSRDNQSNEMVINTDQLSMLNFTRLRLRPFRTKQMRELALKWFPNNQAVSDKVDLLVKTFSALNLPCTPFAVSMFLYIFEKQGETKPRNNAMLIETYLSDLFKTLDPKGSPSDIFDYKNRLRLMAHIAKEMLESQESMYRISYSSFVRVIEEYLKAMRVGNIFPPTKIAQEYINLGVFLKDPDDKVHFRFLCFFEFGLAYAMSEFPDFKDFVLNEDTFLQYINEIIYYTGLNRAETEILEKIISRMDFAFEELNGMVYAIGRNIDDTFNTNQSILSRISSEDLLASLPAKQTEEDENRQGDLKIERSQERRPEVIERKESQGHLNDLADLLRLAMNVLKNSEEVQKPGVKLSSYVKILRNSISYALLVFAIANRQVQRKDISEEHLQELNIIIRFLPYLHQQYLSNNLASLKLTEIIKDKIDEDIASIKEKRISEFEQYLSVFLYSDFKGIRHKDIIKEFLNRINRAYITDISLLNLVNYYYKSKSPEDDNFFIERLTDMYVRANPNSKRTKSQILQDFKQKKQVILREQTKLS